MKWTTYLALALVAAVAYSACSDTTAPPTLDAGSEILASTSSRSVTTVPGNPDCADYGYPKEYKVEPGAAGTFGDGFFEVQIWVHQTALGPTFDFLSNKAVDIVISKGGPAANVYTYDPGVYADNGLHSPVNPNNNKYYGLSHISFCYDPADARIAIWPHGVNEVGKTHELSARVEEDPNGEGDWAPVEGATVTFVTTFGHLDDPAECTTGADGTCTIGLTSDEVGVSTVTASTTIVVGTKQLTRTTDGMANNSGPAEKHWVDAYITITPQLDKNPITVPHTFTVTYTALPDDAKDYDFGAITYTWLTAAPTVLSSTCADPVVVDNVATCQIVINSDQAGTFEVEVEGDVTITVEIAGFDYYDTLNRETDGVAPNSGPAEKEYVDGSLLWYKEDPNGMRLSGAVFQACLTHDHDGAAVDPAECQTGITEHTSPGIFQLSELKLGTWVINETAAPAGYTMDLDPQTVVLTLENPDGVAQFPFVNTPDEFEGCTPGYWRNHTDNWPAAYQTNQTFFGVFAVVTNTQGLAADLTLLQAVNLGGGQFNKLARHAVAALLNAAHPDVNYYLSAQDVIAAVVSAFNSGYSEPLATELDVANNENCPW